MENFDRFIRTGILFLSVLILITGILEIYINNNYSGIDTIMWGASMLIVFDIVNSTSKKHYEEIIKNMGDSHEE